MSTGIALDLNLDDSAWLATLDALLVDVKVDKRSGHTEDDARFKAIAAWANLIDDFVIACKMALRLLYRGNGSPEGVVAAPVGALYQRRDGGPGTTLYTKETGTENTGWAPVGGAAAPADAQYIVAVASGSLSAERVLTTTDTINVDSSVPGLTTLTTLLFTEQSDGGGITEELNYLEVSQVTGLSVTNVAPRHARLAAVRATPVAVGLANAAGSAASLAASDHVHALSAQVIRDASVVFEDDFSARSTQDFANGPTSIGAVSGTTGNRAAAGTWGLVASAGLRWIPAASTAAGFSSSAQTAPHWYATVGAFLGSAFDSAARYIFELYVPTRTYDTGATTLYVGLWGVAGTPTGSIARVRAGGPRQETGVPIFVLLSQTSTTISGADITGFDVFGLEIGDGAMRAHVGTWAAGWPSLSHQNSGGAAVANTDPLWRADTRIVFSFNQISDATPTAQFDIARFRIRRL